MTTSRSQSAQALAAWAWGAVALTPAGWFCGLLAIAYSHLGDVTDATMMLGGVVLFAAAPASAFILAVGAARAGHRSGKAAVTAPPPPHPARPASGSGIPGPPSPPCASSRLHHSSRQ